MSCWAGSKEGLACLLWVGVREEGRVFVELEKKEGMSGWGVSS